MSLKIALFLFAFLISAKLGWLWIFSLFGFAFLAFKAYGAYTTDIGSLRAYPDTAGIYGQILVGAVTKKKWLGDNLPAISTEQSKFAEPVPVSMKVLDGYKKLMKMERKQNCIPLMFFIVEPFGLSMLHMERNIPVSLLGLILARNESEVFRQVKEDELLTPSVSLGEKFRRTEKGDVEFDLIMNSTDTDGFVVWKSKTVVLILNPKRSRGKQARKEAPQPIEGDLIDTWELAGDTGRKYAALNGDINPIHLYPWTSKLFGFQKPIAHALYQVGRSIATLENKKGLDVIGKWKLSTEFKRPTMLPCKLKFYDQSANCSKGFLKFCLATEDGLKEVITGTLEDKS